MRSLLYPDRKTGPDPRNIVFANAIEASTKDGSEAKVVKVPSGNGTGDSIKEGPFGFGKLNLMMVLLGLEN